MPGAIVPSHLSDGIIATHGVSRSRRRRAWRARWRWPSGIAVGANEPIANQADAFDGYGVAQIIDI